jgi:hypothetical protein
VPEHNVTERVTGGTWDVRDLDASYDGTKLIFSMRMPLIPGADDEDQPRWAIWEYDRTTDTLHRVIASDIVANEGHDICPHYLPDGRIVFSSTRQRQSKAILIDEGKPQFAAQDEDRNEHAFVLHVMNADGSDIHQISFNQSHDLDPDVLDDGRIVFSRWENASGSSIHLYTVNPDGSGLELLYGANSTRPAPAARRPTARARHDRRPVPAAAPGRERRGDRAQSSLPGHRAGRRPDENRHAGPSSRSSSRHSQTLDCRARRRHGWRPVTSAPIPACRPAGDTPRSSPCSTVRVAALDLDMCRLNDTAGRTLPARRTTLPTRR